MYQNKKSLISRANFVVSLLFRLLLRLLNFNKLDFALKRGCLIILFVLLYVMASGQTKPYYFKSYQVYNGLSSNIITCITQDSKGFMWFGSRNGLNRFDGTTFKIFRNHTADAASIGSNSIFSLYEDEHEKLWVGTYKGIYIFNPKTETFSAFKHIPTGEVRYIKGDRQHNVWIISDLVLYCYHQQTGRLTIYNLPKDRTITLHITADGQVWTATSTGLIKKYDPHTQSFISYDISLSNQGKKFSAIQEIYPVGDTALIIGTMKQALLFNYRTRHIHNIFEGNKHISDIHTHAIFHQSDGEYWLGTEAGLYTFNLQSNRVAIVQKQYSNPYTITDNIISTIYKDREGGTWLGTYFGGINYYSAQYNNFRKYFPEPGINSLSGNIVHEICKDQYGNLWVGTEDAGLNQLNLSTGHITHFLPGGQKGSISYRNIHGLLADGKWLWIGTYEHGLDVMDLTTHRVIKHYNAHQGPNSFSSDFIVTLYKTRQGDILVGTWNGLFKYNRQLDNFSAIPQLGAPIQTLQEDEHGTLWASSYGGGVYYYNAATGATGHIAYKAGHNNGLVNNYVNSLYEDSRHMWWFSTEGGLCRYHPFTKQFTTYTADNGLPDNQVFKVLEDDAGLLWISTARGLACFNPAAQKFDTYYTANGLPTGQFNYNSAFKDTDGTMYFGTVKGLISFKPSQFIKNAFVPPVYVTGLQINNHDEAISPSSALHQSITFTAAITLPHDSANINLDVAALSYTIPEMNGYQYRLTGIDKNWITLKNNRKIYYTNLPPGNYTFNVKGSNSEGVWNPRETRLHIIILPPWWATAWAYLLYTLAAGGIAVTIFKYYDLAVTEKNKRQIEAIEINTEREIYNAKIEFFTNVAHEIRTPLTLIKMPLDKLLNTHIYQPEINESLHMIKKNTNRLIDLTNQLLDFRKAEANKFSLNFSKTDINELLSDLYAVFKPTADIKELQFKLEIPRITLHAYVDNEALKKIISNLFNNAIKYAGTLVQIKLMPFSSEDSNFSIEVRNDGYCIPEEYQDKIFEPFFRIKETEKEAGTGIGLPLSRSLAQLHKGELTLKESDKGLNVFLLSLPIHQEIEMDFTPDNDVNEPADDDAVISGNLDQDSSSPLILLVEDNREILNYIQHELSAKYRVLKAVNGRDALAILQQENVQLVISDIMMPVMDGIELCKKMKTDIEYSHIPIILLTAKNSLHAKIEGLEVGADAYIEKPFAFEYLLAQINSLLTNRNIVKDYFARSPLTHIKGIACSKADKVFLEHLNQVINAHITDMDLDVDQLSGMMNMSRPTLYRKIKALSDLTPNELINISRLKKAAELLAEGNYKINEVANLVGYSLPTNFSRDFQRQFGVSPSVYIGNLKTDQKQV